MLPMRSARDFMSALSARRRASARAPGPAPVRACHVQLTARAIFAFILLRAPSATSRPTRREPSAMAAQASTAVLPMAPVAMMAAAIES